MYKSQAQRRKSPYFSAPRPNPVRGQLPLLIEKGQDGFYVVECPLLEGCYSQAETIDGAIRNIREVIELILEEKAARKMLDERPVEELSLHTITV